MAEIPRLLHTMSDIKIIALDLDGTLLNSRKELTDIAVDALTRAAEAGIEIVPTTGRFYGGMPASIRKLPFIRFAITINGAQIYDIKNDCAIDRAEIPLNQAIRIMTYLDGLPVIYDCYQNNWGWMTRTMQDQAEAFAPDENYVGMLRVLRTPVDELKAFLSEKGEHIQKIQLFTRDESLRGFLLKTLDKQFDQLSVSSSVANNVEINNIHANKGLALRKLAAYLDCEIGQTMAIGDGLNDISMIEQAGIGIAMENACEQVKAVANAITASCDHDGVAVAIDHFCFNSGSDLVHLKESLLL